MLPAVVLVSQSSKQRPLDYTDLTPEFFIGASNAATLSEVAAAKVVDKSADRRTQNQVIVSFCSCV